jgi:hypothetical protein
MISLALALAQSQVPTPLRTVAEGPALRSLSGFVENVGQWDKRVLFFAREGGIEATVLADGFLLRPAMWYDEDGNPVRPPEGVFFQFAGGARAAEVIGAGVQETLHNFFLGSRSGSGARGFGQLRFEEVQPGVDLVLRHDDLGFAYDVHVEAGASFEGFGFDLAGARDLAFGEYGQLTIQSDAGPIHHRFGPTTVFDPVTGRAENTEPEVRVDIDHASRIWISAPKRTKDQGLLIDPTLEFATYLGGSSSNSLIDVAVTAEGAKYLLLTGASGLPTLPWSYSPVLESIWVGALTPDGTGVFAATFLGGTATDTPLRVFATHDSISVVGSTWSNDFPLTNNLAGSDGTLADMFVTRFSVDGSTLMWSTLVGGNDQDVAEAAALAVNGEVVVAGRTKSTNIDVSESAFDEVFDSAPSFGGGPGDRLIFRLSCDGQQILASTWFYTLEVEDMLATPNGDVIFTGDFCCGGDGQVPTTVNTLHSTYLGQDETVGHITRMKGDMSGLVWSTYVSDGSNGDSSYNLRLAIDCTESVYFGSQATQFGHPTTPGAYEESNLFGCGWIGKLLPQGTGFAWATYLAGNLQAGTQAADAIVVDEAGNVTVSGTTNKPAWPVTPDAYQPEFVGPSPNADVALTRFDAVAETLDYSTWFGGNGGESDPRLAVGDDGRIVLGFSSRSNDLPTTEGAYQQQHGGNNDAVIAVFDLGLRPWRLLGPGLKGSRETPNLVGLGDLTPGSPARLALRGTEPNALVFWVGGFSEVNIPLLGGTLVPFPAAVVPGQAGANGWLDLTFPWPNLAPGTVFTVQAWCLDPAAPQGFGASNGLRAIAQ